MVFDAILEGVKLQHFVWSDHLQRFHGDMDASPSDFGKGETRVIFCRCRSLLLTRGTFESEACLINE